MKRSLIIALACVGMAQAQPVQVRAQVDKARVGLGETIVLTEDVTGTAADLPAADSLRFPPFEVRDAIATQLPGGQGTRYTVRLASYQDGPQTIPALSIAYKTATGESQTAQSAPLQVQVERAAAQQATADIHDLKPMEATAIPTWMKALGAALGTVLVGLACAGLVGLWRRRRAAKLNPEDQALQALQKLAGQDLPRQGRLKLHYDRLSEILRTYLARRFELPVLEHTSGEVVGMLDAEVGPPVGQVLYEADLVKFARLQVSPDQALAQIAAVRNIVKNAQKEL